MDVHTISVFRNPEKGHSQEQEWVVFARCHRNPLDSLWAYQKTEGEAGDFAKGLAEAMKEGEG